MLSCLVMMVLPLIMNKLCNRVGPLVLWPLVGVFSYGVSKLSPQSFVCLLSGEKTTVLHPFCPSMVNRGGDLYSLYCCIV